MTFSQRFEEIRTGFERPFWVANISELFERLSYYAVFAVLARYLHEGLHFDVERASSLTGMFGGWVWFLAVIGGAVADRLGFRRALSLAYLILSIAYFLLGSIGADWFAPLRDAMPLVTLVAIVLMLPALGVALVKPSVVGTTARASQENVRSVGYSIYYTLVNVGSTAGPYLASWVHQHGSVANVFRLAALSVFIMLFLVLLLFKEPRRAEEGEAATLSQVGKNFLTVLSNPRFMLFLLIFTGYWIVFWQQFTSLPGYIHKFIDPNARVERVLSIDAAVVICFTLLWNHLIRKVPPFRAVILGTLISSLSWLILAFWSSYWGAVLSIFVLALGEITQAPKYYEYIAKLAPPEQQGTYMGFAFLPIGIGSLVGGWFGGTMLHHFGEVQHQPQGAWLAITAVGILTTLLLWIYDRAIRPKAEEA